MKELSLNILDLAQNGIKAGAKLIGLEVNEDEAGYFVFRVRDDGCGMTPDMVQKIRDPFFTTRTTRKVGMGVSLVDMLTTQSRRTSGYQICTRSGTLMEAYFAKDNIDRPPLGDLPATMKVLVAGAPKLDFTLSYKHGAKVLRLIPGNCAKN
jgi:K+-sensing histidine kinase KdpD